MASSPSRHSYSVSIPVQPAGETCKVAGASGKVKAAPVTSIAVACIAKTTYSIGGAVSGLTSGQSVTLLDNGGDSKTVSANGGFTFATKLSTGAGYDVTVHTQPTGETCTINNASGKVGTTNVTNVAVACSKNSGGGGSGHYWIPFNAAPFNGASDGQNGLFLIASDKITSSPAPQYITTQTTSNLASTFSVSSGTSILLTPALLMYQALGGDGKTHIYGLTLDDTSSLPTPVQISSLALDSTQTICSNGQAQTDLSDPTTLFIVIEVGDAASDCGTGAATFAVVHFKDSAGTAPTTVDIDDTEIDPLYANGKLAGLVNIDDKDSILNLYADNTFNSPTHLVSSVSFYEAVAATKLDYSDPLNSSSNLFLQIATNSNTTDPTGLYYLGASSKSVAKVHVGTIGDTVTDDNNLYFEDTTSGTETDIYQVPLTNGTVTELFEAPTSGTNSTISTGLIGGNNSLLVFEQETRTNATPPVDSQAFFTIPVGTLSSKANQIGSTYPGLLTQAFLAAPSGAGLPGNKLFVTLLKETITPPSTITFGYSSTVLALDGSTNPSPTANSAFGSFGLTEFYLNGGVWKVTGITDKSGGFGGGTLNQVNVSTLSATPMTTTGGGNAVFTPATFNGYTGFLEVFASDGTGPGEFIDINVLNAPSYGAALDTGNNFFYPLIIKDTSVQPY